MPWKERDRMSERVEFARRLARGERMTDLCREYGISRKTGYKYKKRYEEQGARGLFDQSRRPRRSPQRTPNELVERIIALRRKHPTWGPKKLKKRLETLDPEVRWPAASTISVLLKDEGLVTGRRRRRRASPTPPSERVVPTRPNELWCMDFKGQFRLGNREYCYPLTVTDQVSRFLLGCDGLSSTHAEPAGKELEMVFLEHGLPDGIRSDNGPPFASTGLGGLTQLSVWLMRLQIRLERIDPGCPQQNGRHERMHRTLKQDTTRPAANNMLLQQEKFDEFRRVFNEERPHEALDMQTPASVYTPSTRALPSSLPPVRYPLHDDVMFVSKSGQGLFRGQRYYVSQALAGQAVGLRHIEADVWLTTFMDLDLAYLNTTDRTVTPIAQEPAKV